MLARGITHVENGTEFGQKLLRLASKNIRRVPVIGITGAPGAGKSTLISRVINYLSGHGKQIGVIAVDPSSPFSNGAILGDRIRMLDSTHDPNIFVRSLSSRGHLGGLSSAAFAVLQLMQSYPFDIILVETVGAGQSEVEVMNICDVTCLVIVPGMGDGIQALKAGIMEIADIYVINKSDLPGVELLESQLKNMQNLVMGVQRPIIRVSATKGEGIDTLVNMVLSHQSIQEEGKIKRLMVSIIRDRVGEHLMNDPLVEELSLDVVEGRRDLYDAVEDIIKERGFFS